MACLLNAANEERDFFANIVHLQNHRIIAAIHLLNDCVKAGSIGHVSMETFLLPIVACILINSEACRSMHCARITLGQANRDGVVNASIDCIRSMALHLTWDCYRSWLLKLLHLIPKKVIMRLCRRSTHSSSATLSATCSKQ